MSNELVRWRKKLPETYDSFYGKVMHYDLYEICKVKEKWRKENNLGVFTPRLYDDWYSIVGFVQLYFSSLIMFAF